MRAPWEAPEELEEITGTGFAACAWDLALLRHERQSWMGTVLSNPSGPDLDAYLQRRLTGHI